MVLVDAACYCGAPPLATSSRLLLPPRPTRASEARRPCAPLRAVKAEIRESETDSVEFGVDNEDVKPDVAQIKIEPDPRQIFARVAAIRVRQPASTASKSSEEAQGPSTSSYRTQPLCRIPASWLGPADPDSPGN